MTLAESSAGSGPARCTRSLTTRADTALGGPVAVRIDRMSGTYGFYVKHALGETKINWPLARHVSRDDDGTLHLRGTDEHAGEPHLTLRPSGGPS